MDDGHKAEPGNAPERQRLLNCFGNGSLLHDLQPLFLLGFGDLGNFPEAVMNGEDMAGEDGDVLLGVHRCPVDRHLGAQAEDDELRIAKVCPVPSFQIEGNREWRTGGEDELVVFDRLKDDVIGVLDHHKGN